MTHSTAERTLTGSDVETLAGVVGVPLWEEDAEAVARILTDTLRALPTGIPLPSFDLAATGLDAFDQRWL